MNDRNPKPRELRALLQVLTVKDGFRSLGQLESSDNLEFWERYSNGLDLNTLRYSVDNGNPERFKDGDECVIRISDESVKTFIF